MKWLIALVLSVFLGGGPADVAPTQALTPTPTTVVRKSFVLLDVPFTSQAPNGEWSDPRHQDGCEETAALMAAVWAGKESIEGRESTARKIEEIWEWQVRNYGGARDTSAEDTAKRIIGGYFGYKAYSVQRLASREEIIDELTKGNVVIVPVDGRGLNPNYTAPGPERHMILIRGYDDSAGEFITNDAGTRRGEKYRYKYQTLFNAIRDYSTGYHVPIVEIEKKMIVISEG